MHVAAAVAAALLQFQVVYGHATFLVEDAVTPQQSAVLAGVWLDAVVCKAHHFEVVEAFAPERDPPNEALEVAVGH